MSRPETAHDVVALVRRANLAGEADLAGLLVGLTDEITAARVFSLLVASGLLTPYQADELAVGRWQGFWFGGYKVLDRLGRGGMGHVYLAEHGILRTRVALKVLSAGLRADPTARRRFVREARAAAAVDHPNVVRVHNVDMDHDPPFLVMEFVDGVSVQAAVARHGAFSAAEAVAVGVEVARGLVAAAAAGLVHRDVKPANLLIDRRGGVKILDLGIVRLPGDDTRPRLDGADVILGTLDYLAPEQAIDSAAVDARADLYALGATLYFALAGHPPFPGNDVRHKLVAKQYSDPPPIYRLRPDLETGLSDAIQTLLARDPAARFQTAAAVVEALAPFAGPTPNFPHRLFRSQRPSTVSDAPPCEAPHLPDTQRIVKSAAAPPPPPEEGVPTDELRKGQTDLSMSPLRESSPLQEERPKPDPKPGGRPARFRRWLWVALGACGLLAAIALKAW